MTYHVEVQQPVGHKTDFSTRSLTLATDRRLELARRGEAAIVVNGAGRVVIDHYGDLA